MIIASFQGSVEGPADLRGGGLKGLQAIIKCIPALAGLACVCCLRPGQPTGAEMHRVLERGGCLGVVRLLEV